LGSISDDDLRATWDKAVNLMMSAQKAALNSALDDVHGRYVSLLGNERGGHADGYHSDVIGVEFSSLDGQFGGHVDFDVNDLSWLESLPTSMLEQCGH
jgi:hypothetical protein